MEPRTASASSADSGAAPENTWRTDDRSYWSTIGCLASATTIGGATSAGHPMVLVQLQELRKIEAGHRDDGGAGPQRVFISTCMP